MMDEFLEMWKRQEQTQKNRELTNEVVNSLMMNEIQDINDRQEKAFTRCQRNRKW